MVRIITQYGTLLGIKRKRLILFTEIFSTLRKWQEHSFLVDYLTKVIHGKTIPPNFIAFSINPNWHELKEQWKCSSSDPPKEATVDWRLPQET